jgi:hypothetical protein
MKITYFFKKNNINWLTYQYKNTYLHKWFLPFFLPFLPLCYSNFLDVTVANIHIKHGLAMGFNFLERKSANRHKTHKLWHQSSLTQTITSTILLLSVCMYNGNPLHHTQKHWYMRTKGISTTLLYSLINTALLAEINITSLSAGHKYW